MAESKTVQLAGAGALGLDENLKAPKPAECRGVAAVPVRLGRREKSPDEGAPKLAEFFEMVALKKALPPSTNWREKATASIKRVYANDRLGCCVVSGKFHHVGLWTGADSDSGGEVQGSDEEVIQQYRSICGPGDNGCIITDVLKVMRDRGLTIGGRPRKIGGYVRVDHTKPELVKASIALLGGLTIGFNLPGDWPSSAVWDVSNARIVGGHDVCCVDYDDSGVYVASWGRLYKFTWRAWADRRYIDEAYCLLSPDWSGNDKLAPSGLNVEKLQEALSHIGGGRVPPDEPPPPPPPPPPHPEHCQYQIDLAVKLGGQTGTITGTVTHGVVPFSGEENGDHGDHGDERVIECHNENLAACVEQLLWPLEGITHETRGTAIVIQRGKLPPGSWAKIIEAILAIISILTENRT